MAAATEKLDLLKSWLPVSAVVGIVALGVAGGSEMRSIRLAIEQNSKNDERLLSMMAERPTSAAMESSILKAMRPIDSGMAKVEAELRALSDRVRRLEESRD